MVKEAFFSGFLEKHKQKKRQQAMQGFAGSMASVNAATAHHPIPKKLHIQWADEADKEPNLRGHAAGWNFHTDRFNAWLKTPDGNKWNDAQAKKLRASR